MPGPGRLPVYMSLLYGSGVRISLAGFSGQLLRPDVSASGVSFPAFRSWFVSLWHGAAVT